MHRIIFAVVVGTLLWAAPASAHQPAVVTGTGPVLVTDPEISKAYYDELTGAPRVYRIDSAVPFKLYVNLLVPRDTNGDARYTATIDRGTTRIGTVSAEGWKPMFEEFGRDWYVQGPEFSAQVGAGTYSITVSGVGSDTGKYTLAVGDVESFPPSVIWRTVHIIPYLKANFFGKSAAWFALTPFGAPYVLALLALGMLIAYVQRVVMHRWTTGERRAVRNIGLSDRLVRIAITLGLLAWGLTSWSALVFIIAGYTLFESFSRWCGFYALLGRNTCPI